MRGPFSNTRCPESIDVSPASMRSSVVLPAPLRPDSVIRSRRSSLNETPRKSGSPAMSLPRSEAIRTATAMKLAGGWETGRVRARALAGVAGVLLVLLPAPALAAGPWHRWRGTPTGVFRTATVSRGEWIATNGIGQALGANTDGKHRTDYFASFDPQG